MTRKHVSHVFQPGYVIDVYSASHYGTLNHFMSGIPLAGKWVEKPNYFRQVTYGHRLNDVIHAKLVDSPRLKRNLRVWDGVVYKSATNVYYYREYATSADSMSTDSNRSTFWLSHRAPYDEHQSPEVNDERAKRESLVICGTVTPSGYSYLGKKYFFSSFQLAMYAIPDEADLTLNRVKLAKVVSNVRISGNWRTAQVTETHDALFDSLPNFPAFIEKIRWYGYNLSALPPGEIHRRLIDLWSNYMGSIDPILLVSLTKETGTVGNTQYRIYPIDPAAEKLNLKDSFILGEKAFMAGSRTLAALTVGLNGYNLNYMLQHAYKEAIDDIPQLSSNEIQNLIELVGIVKSLVVDHTIELPERLSDAWLQYRYRLNTSLSDFEEAWAFVKKMYDWSSWGKDLLLHGQSTLLINDEVDVTCRCRLCVRPKYISKFAEILRAIDVLGLSPDFYVLWDSLPYSFMVDWFIPVGDLLDVADKQRTMDQYWIVQDMCYSLEYTREVSNGAWVRCYTRWKSDPPRNMNGMYWLEPVQSSSQTTLMRVIDAASIILKF